MDSNKTPSKHSLASLIMLLAIVNLLILDLLIVRNFLANEEKQTTKTGAVSVTRVPSNTENAEQDCSPSCQSAIQKEIDSFKLTPQPTSNQTTIRTIVQPTIVITQITASQQNSNPVKEFFVPLGSGSTSATEWTDISGARAEVNSNSYGSIKQVLFEASVHVPNNNQIVEVRLYNESDGYAVGNSEFLYSSGTTQNFRIASIQLGSGAKTYKVQMKTQLGYNAVLDQARIHITTN